MVLRISYIQFVVAASGLGKDLVGHFSCRTLYLFSIEDGVSL
ncbi:MAG: hypothetical protein ACRD5E_00035 [Nitrososphaeraceae archaeon]